jgi:hypothetical protein
MGTDWCSPNKVTIFLRGHQVTEEDDTPSKGTGLYAKVGNVTLELVPKFQSSRSDLVAIKVSGYLLNKEDKPLTTEERKQLHEHKFS